MPTTTSSIRLRSHIGFSVHHLLGTARGEFHKFSGAIEVDPKQPERSSVNVTIEVTSIDTQIKQRDNHLLGADFFNASRFPEITFRSRSVKQTSSNSGDITGDIHHARRDATADLARKVAHAGRRRAHALERHDRSDSSQRFRTDVFRNG